MIEGWVRLESLVVPATIRTPDERQRHGDLNPSELAVQAKLCCSSWLSTVAICHTPQRLSECLKSLWQLATPFLLTTVISARIVSYTLIRDVGHR